MGNKEYYTPNKDDFYFGFEFQVSVPYTDKWVNTILDDDEEWRFIDSVYFHKEEKERLRVSYLCKQDIIDLAWKFEVFGINDSFKRHLPKNYVFDEKDYPFESWFSSGKYWMGFYDAIHKIAIIEKGDFPDGQTIRFAGICKSKNELKKLMKDYLNIPI